MNHCRSADVPKKPKLLHPKPQTLKPQTLNLKPKTPNSKHFEASGPSAAEDRERALRCWLCFGGHPTVKVWGL